MNEWISVKDRLPEEDILVLVFIPYWRKISTDRLGKDGCWRGAFGEAITHWMPLPEPPQHEGE